MSYKYKRCMWCRKSKTPDANRIHPACTTKLDIMLNAELAETCVGWGFVRNVYISGQDIFIDGAAVYPHHNGNVRSVSKVNWKKSKGRVALIETFISPGKFNFQLYNEKRRCTIDEKELLEMTGVFNQEAKTQLFFENETPFNKIKWLPI